LAEDYGVNETTIGYTWKNGDAIEKRTANMPERVRRNPFRAR